MKTLFERFLNERFIDGGFTCSSCGKGNLTAPFISKNSQASCEYCGANNILNTKNVQLFINDLSKLMKDKEEWEILELIEDWIDGADIPEVLTMAYQHNVSPAQVEEYLTQNYNENSI